MSWFVTHAAALQTYALVVGLAAAALWESFVARRTLAHDMRRRWTANVALLGLNMVVTRVALPLTSLAVALAAQERGFGLFNAVHVALPVAVVLGVLLLDLAGYAQHRLLHAVPLLWRVHQIHHADIDVDCGTAVRHHPGEALLVAWVDLAIVLALGVPPEAVVAFSVLATFVPAVNHANGAWAPGLERMLRPVVVTPDLHRIHHSALLREGNSNFAVVLPLWDRVFGTYVAEPALGHAHMQLGLAEYREDADLTLGALLLMPVRTPRGPMQAPA